MDNRSKGHVAADSSWKASIRENSLARRPFFLLIEAHFPICATVLGNGPHHKIGSITPTRFWIERNPSNKTGLICFRRFQPVRSFVDYLYGPCC